MEERAENQAIDLASELYLHQEIKVDSKQGLLRIDKFLFNRLANTSRTRIQKAIEAENVKVDGKAIKANYKVKPNEKIQILLPYPAQQKELKPQNLNLNIIYEDLSVIVVNKAANMVVHPGYNQPDNTLVNGILYHTNQKASTLPSTSADGMHRPGLVHRLDKNTTGLIVLCKTEYGLAFLSKQFFNHSVERSYIALVWGDIQPQGTISGYIGRSNKDRRIMQLFCQQSKGKWSVTHFKKIKSFGFCSLIQCSLETGRTHQIRCHMQKIGHPIFADSEYGGGQIDIKYQLPKFKSFIKNCYKMISRQALHAKSLGFIHPETKKKMNFQTALPQDMQALIDKIENFNSAL